eukprot:1158344-Pelagomonas_calceolata.AAC.23
MTRGSGKSNGGWPKRGAKSAAALVKRDVCWAFCNEAVIWRESRRTAAAMVAARTEGRGLRF